MQCLLCDALTNGATPEAEAFNRPLFESDEYVVIPALGPLLPGHVMVVSKRHFASLASMGPGGIASYEKIFEELRRLWPEFMYDALEAEHGGVTSVKNGPCIMHTHVNIIPGAGRFLKILDGKLPRLDIKDLSSISDVTTPYFYMRANGETVLYNGNQGQSQIVRRLILERLNQDDWNWAVYPRMDMVNETIKLWSENR